MFSGRFLEVIRMRIQKKQLLMAVFAVCILAAGCGNKNSTSGAESTGAEIQSSVETETDAKTEASDKEVASGKETVSAADVVEEGMTPIYGTGIKDGVYSVKVDSSSGMFKITGCELTVKDGAMSAVMTMGGTGYLKLYMGTGEEAVKASEEDYIPYKEAADGANTFEVPVEALDMGIDCSAFSKNKEKWYDRVLVFRSDSLPAEAFSDGNQVTADSLKLEDGAYTAEVTLGGGSGKASVESPAHLRVENGKAYASVIWSSSNYDYMKVGEEKFELVNTEGNSAFEIPVSFFDRKMPVSADTVAMSTPHEIEYTLTFDSSTLKKAE